MSTAYTSRKFNTVIEISVYRLRMPELSKWEEQHVAGYIPIYDLLTVTDAAMTVA